MNQPRDKGLNGNEKIEQAVAALQQEPTQEQLAHTLTAGGMHSPALTRK